VGAAKDDFGARTGGGRHQNREPRFKGSGTVSQFARLRQCDTIIGCSMGATCSKAPLCVVFPPDEWVALLSLRLFVCWVSQAE
jgi:hypothetical protein